MKFDDIDLKIIERLQSDGRITNAKLAAEANISPPGMIDRVKRLEKAGVIKQYAALVDPAKVGRGTMAMVMVSLAIHQLPSVEDFTDAVKSLDEVLECFHITGADDFLLKVAVRDLKEYEEFVLNKLSRIRGVGKITTNMVLSTIKYESKIPVNIKGENEDGHRP